MKKYYNVLEFRIGETKFRSFKMSGKLTEPRILVFEFKNFRHYLHSLHVH